MVDDEEFITNACVVDNVSMSVDVILGTNILTQGEVHINKDNVSVSKFNAVQITDVHNNKICVNGWPPH